MRISSSPSQDYGYTRRIGELPTRLTSDLRLIAEVSRRGAVVEMREQRERDVGDPERGPPRHGRNPITPETIKAIIVAMQTIVDGADNGGFFDLLLKAAVSPERI